MKATGVRVQFGSKQDNIARVRQQPITLDDLRELVRETQHMSASTLIQVNDTQQLDEMTWHRFLRIRVVEWTEETANVAISK
ncbi:hypothetical protein FDI69_gp006 [Rhodococcus phage Trina]|uniref:Uncharacterized protein n=1 Tax=Rhodococcus phage Trina TaxID=2027905 RepID=A0A2D1AD57_9CAUD|nr:hypothetical protein FDI69_gp006 [Rhodococcus phage Trina]ASZ74824.1 hypothetical protein SEA_TRINA_6 [Rhodococcus phage Trina]